MSYIDLNPLFEKLEKKKMAEDLKEADRKVQIRLGRIVEGKIEVVEHVKFTNIKPFVKYKESDIEQIGKIMLNGDSPSPEKLKQLSAFIHKKQYQRARPYEMFTMFALWLGINLGIYTLFQRIWLASQDDKIPLPNFWSTWGPSNFPWLATVLVAANLITLAFIAIETMEKKSS